MRKSHFYQFKSNISKTRVKPKNSMMLAKLREKCFSDCIHRGLLLEYVWEAIQETVNSFSGRGGRGRELETEESFTVKSMPFLKRYFNFSVCFFIHGYNHIVKPVIKNTSTS